MENLQQVFIDETAEKLLILEKSLLQLEADASDTEGIGNVFRVIHTVKGSSGMFGYDSISALTHQLETIFEKIRDGHSRLTQDILKVTFQSMDQLQALLYDPKMTSEAILINQERLLANIEKINNSLITIHEKTELFVDSKDRSTLFYISFTPSEFILKNGNNPLFLIEDLLALGTGLSLPHYGAVPELNDLQSDSSYITFEVILETNKSAEEVQDVFIFVAADSAIILKKIPVSNGFLTSAFQEKLMQIYHPGSILGYETVCAAAGVEASDAGEAVSLELQTDKKNPADHKVLKANHVVSSVRISSERLDELMNLVSELVTTQARLSLFSVGNISGELGVITENVEKITRRLRDNAFSMSLIPIESLVVRFQRLVRDLSQELNKEVEFITEGTETEIDKSIIEKLTDPMLHLLRNSLDHGLESAEERLRKGKPAKGTIVLKAFYSGANVAIEMSDDGAGINLEKVKNKAISNGMISADAQLDEKEIINLIFLPGFSTADKITGVSGRGVGMDVVRRNIADIRGEVDIVTKKDVGTTYRIRLPLTLSIIDGLLVKIGNTCFILPLSYVNKCFEVKTEILEQSFNSWVTLDGQRTPFILLRQDFNMTENKPEFSQVIKVSYNGSYVALVFDRIIGEYQAVLKPLSNFYHAQDEFSGATILGDGTVALVIDPYRLIQKTTDAQTLKNAMKYEIAMSANCEALNDTIKNKYKSLS